MNDLRVGVVGVGHHGRHHARNLAAMPGVKLVGVVDANAAVAQQVAETCQTQAMASPADLLSKVDAVIVAVPTIAHHGVAKMFLEAGVAVLVEKPLVFSPDEGRELVRVARKNRITLAVGHIERHNPAWSAVADFDGTPSFVECHRLSRYPFRSLDVSVVFDVMIHDIDLVLAATGSRVRAIHASGGAVLSPSPDWAEVRLEMANGAAAHLSASRVHHDIRRTMRLMNVGHLIEIDFAQRSSSEQTLRTMPKLSSLTTPATPVARESLLRETFAIRSVQHDREVEPLRRELDDFIDAIRTGRDPRVTGEDGLDAVCIAAEIDRQIAKSTIHSQPKRAA